MAGIEVSDSMGAGSADGGSWRSTSLRHPRHHWPLAHLAHSLPTCHARMYHLAHGHRLSSTLHALTGRMGRCHGMSAVRHGLHSDGMGKGLCHHHGWNHRTMNRAQLQSMASGHGRARMIRFTSGVLSIQNVQTNHQLQCCLLDLEPPFFPLELFKTGNRCRIDEPSQPYCLIRRFRLRCVSAQRES